MGARGSLLWADRKRLNRLIRKAKLCPEIPPPRHTHPPLLDPRGGCDRGVTGQRWLSYRLRWGNISHPTRHTVTALSRFFSDRLQHQWCVWERDTTGLSFLLLSESVTNPAVDHTRTDTLNNTQTTSEQYSLSDMIGYIPKPIWHTDCIILCLSFFSSIFIVSFNLVELSILLL